MQKNDLEFLLQNECFFFCVLYSSIILLTMDKNVVLNEELNYCGHNLHYTLFLTVFCNIFNDVINVVLKIDFSDTINNCA